ncbi:allophanate hydrolase [Rhodococcoides fascians]|uniref:5-oxoprolinase subunit C family protein n=1 Tax=Rhodococcoides fascians TaxID=1828 RepID=UPI000B9BBC73|nr:biotin-dependent carboxyltransferase family protein [Rhodococcus fascians]OZE92411.1 allophanate hydrolase [Rhodococcus fascians]OZF23044.1 allophanate hydrolase [Rhodococcus fascians]OZF24758.1 allophanate hydrolase [Rhodococcus fascians]OZF73007.1 allophanate hydrolase [Rhodococcus fascians]OZF74172.1 allophanate hydrolase [Rhodococcus fascians]
MKKVEILDPGPLSLIEDLGRVGHLQSGVGCSGAADRGALKLANRMVGNPEGAASIEVLLGGLTLRGTEDLIVAVTGAPAPTYLDGLLMGHASTIVVPAGQHLTLKPPAVGLRSFVAVRGGLDVEPILGSRSTDTLSGIGPAPLQRGDMIAVGRPVLPLPSIDVAPVALPTSRTIVLRATLGPRENWFLDPTSLATQPWTVSSQSNRVGVRLDRTAEGAVLERSRLEELPTEAVPLGAVQVPPSGQPVIFLADHPITGGYPVVAVVDTDDIDLAAQARPGQRLRFVLH